MERMFRNWDALDANDMVDAFSRHPGSLAIGTDPDEWWEGFEAISAMYVQPGPGLGDHAVGRKAVRDSPAARASRLAVEVVALVGRGHPCGDGGEAAADRKRT